MYRVGHAFHTCGCNGPGWIPKSTNDYLIYLVSKRQHYEEQLAAIEQSDELTPEGKKEAAEYWTTRIQAIDREQRSMA
ncbi:MAG: hypothetical protein CMJ47_13290 [Planctomyces sp.]|nr:hypothetical protein [Planctomyces sp.]